MSKQSMNLWDKVCSALSSSRNPHWGCGWLSSRLNAELGEVRIGQRLSSGVTKFYYQFQLPFFFFFFFWLNVQLTISQSSDKVDSFIFYYFFYFSISVVRHALGVPYLVIFVYVTPAIFFSLFFLNI